MAHERGRRIDVENERRVELRNYTHNLTNKILRKENGEVGREIPERTLVKFQEKSRDSRNEYWDEKANGVPFAGQLFEWIGDPEEGGITHWVAKQTDQEVLSILKEVGLRDDDENRPSLQGKLEGKKVAEVIQAINTDLANAGHADEQLTMGELLLKQTESMARSIIFYANYLNTTEKNGDDTRSLIDTIVKKASSESGGDIDRTINILQKIAPLFAVAGVNMQDALGALMVAKAHALDDHAKVQAVPADAGLNEYERAVWDKLSDERPMQPAAPQTSETQTAASQTVPEDEGQSYTETAPEPQPLEAGKKYDVAQEFAQLKPPARKEGNPYWVEHVPSDFADTLTDDQIAQLGIAKTFFVPEQGKPGYFFPNEEVFPQARALFHKNPRFDNGEALTQGDSGILAEAAASAATPEEQAQLYRQLGKVILRVHEKNPQLLADFLQAQSQESISQFAFFDIQKASPLLDSINQQTAQQIRTELYNRFHIDWNLNMPLEGDAAKLRDNLSMASLERQQKILHDITDQQNRLIAFGFIENPDPNAIEPYVAAPVLDGTLAVWPDRIAKLQQALQQDPPSLTPEQMRQIEFLGHSVDTAKIIRWMQGNSMEVVESAVPLPPQPPVSASEVPSVSEPQPEAQRTQEQTRSLQQLFNFINDEVKKGINEGKIAKQRKEMIVEHPEQLSEFTDMYGGDFRQYLLKLGDIPEDAPETFMEKLTAAIDGKPTISAWVGDRMYEWFEGPNTILAYIAEAGKDSQDQQVLLAKLVRQIEQLYDRHDQLRSEVGTKLTDGAALAPTYQHAVSLFENHEVLIRRVREIREGIEKNQQLTKTDYFDLGCYASFLDLEVIVDRMKPEQIQQQNIVKEILEQPTNEPSNNNPEPTN